MKTILVTGSAGFIGWKVASLLLENGYLVIGVDNLNDYYDVRIKLWRLDFLKKHENFKFYPIDIENKQALEVIFQENKIDAIINEAARAGVRYSLENPFVYLSTNTLGVLNLLEVSRAFDVKKFVQSSTSSLYAGQKMPFVEELPVNTPISPYAASKKGAEAMLYSYHYLYGIDVSILRYFTVYGPAGRPDMSIFRFIKWINEGIPIELFGDGSQSRDFTYIDDIAIGTIKALKPVGYEIINLGNNKPDKLMYAIELIEKHLNKKAKINYREFHKADMMATWADISKAKKLLDWQPAISLEDGIKNTVNWTLQNWDFIKDIKL